MSSWFPSSSMNCSNSPSLESDLWAPVVQAWQSSQNATKITTLWQSKKWEPDYSSNKKAYYAVAPSNSSSFNEAPVMGRFNVTRLRQTDALDCVSSYTSSPAQWGVVSLGKTLSPLLRKIGTMTDLSTGENLGTCTLIAHNLVLVARHAVAGRSIQTVNVTFGYTQFQGSLHHHGHTRFEAVLEQNDEDDYAIVQLQKSLGKDLGFVSFNTDSPVMTECALLHYPLGKPLQVSVHTFVHTEYQTDLLTAYHDSDYFSSGGAYFDPSGRMVAIHLGAELQGDTMHLVRSARPLEAIVRQNPHSLLSRFVNRSYSQAASYTANAALLYLPPTDHNYLLDEEGRASEKVLRELLPDNWKKDANIKKKKNGRIWFEKPTLAHIEKTYPKEYETCIERCLGKTGLHKLTHLFSITETIESDHTIPHHVWASTENPKMNKFVKGTGKRSGENEMPAITIPWDIHRILLTTGRSTEAQKFHQSLIDLCDKDQIDEALILCYQDYKNKGLKLTAYKSDIERSLDDYVDLGLISTAQKKKIIKKVF